MKHSKYCFTKQYSCDLDFICFDGNIKAHKIVLIEKSDFIKMKCHNSNQEIIPIQKNNFEVEQVKNF